MVTSSSAWQKSHHLRMLLGILLPYEASKPSVSLDLDSRVCLNMTPNFESNLRISLALSQEEHFCSQFLLSSTTYIQFSATLE